ncbi:MAG: ATP-dependent metalloprotease FtsH, partial [Anaerocolumna sp.]|nr:ATP-dependent metalloprotease FtsH [Anaerocolumna sp.]
IEKATSLARAMVTQYGMSEKFGLMGLESVENRYLDGRPVLNCGDATAAEIDHEVMNILKACYKKAEELLDGNRDVLDKIADFLIEKETITGKEFMKIFREVKGIPEPEEETSNGKSEVEATSLETHENAVETLVEDSSNQNHAGGNEIASIHIDLKDNDDQKNE